MNIADATGTIFNIQKFSIHDGRGIRTLVFLKGCPLRCRWCANPESQKKAVELSWNEKACLNCGACAQLCARGAASTRHGKTGFERSSCVPDAACACARSCPGGALSFYGKVMTAGAVLEAVASDEVFYRRSRGGLTLGGGEPLFQPDFTRAILRLAKKARIAANMETCGYAETETFLETAALLDCLYLDIKCLDPQKHRLWTGRDNALILKNFRAVRKEFPDLPITVRTPVIPGFNDNARDIGAIASYLRQFAGVGHELLPYHRLGEQKYARLGRICPMGGRELGRGAMQRLEELCKPRNIQVPSEQQ